MKIFNSEILELNVLHFQGSASASHLWLLQELCNKKLTNIPDNIEFISIWTNDNACYLYKQFQNNSFKLINALSEKYVSDTWYMPNKIYQYIDALKNTSKPYAMLLDGYDVIFNTFDDLLLKYNRIGYDILFNASTNNYPNCEIDNLPYRDLIGNYKFFNAGCCIGKTEALINFYTEALDYINIKNPRNSEQFVLRHVFKKYSDNLNNNFVGIDYKCNIFQTMCNSAVIDAGKENYVII